MAARKKPKKAVKRRTRYEPATAFESDLLQTYPTWKKVLFYIGILGWFGAAFWIVRLIIYLVMQNRPKRERLDTYTTQMYVFGWINAIVLALIIVFVVLMILFIIAVPLDR